MTRNDLNLILSFIGILGAGLVFVMLIINPGLGLVFLLLFIVAALLWEKTQLTKRIKPMIESQADLKNTKKLVVYSSNRYWFLSGFFYAFIFFLFLVKIQISGEEIIGGVWVPIYCCLFIIYFSILGIVRPIIILFDENIKTRGSLDPYFKVHLWKDIYKVETRNVENPRKSKLVIFYGPYNYREYKVKQNDLKLVLEFISAKLSPGKVGVSKVEPII